MERRIYEVYGMHPQDVDLLTFREMLQMLGAARERERSQMRASAEIVAAIYNFGGMVVPKQPKGPSDLYPDLYPGARRAKIRDARAMQDAGARADEYYKRLIKSGAKITIETGRPSGANGKTKPPGAAPHPERIMRGRRR